MRFQRENCSIIDSPSKKMIEQQLKNMKSAGSSSFACLEAVNGSYVQIVGGPQLFAVECKDKNGSHYRGYQEASSIPFPFPDGTQLVFSAGKLTLKQNEWFQAPQIAELLSGFVVKPEMPKLCGWSKLDQSCKYS